MGGNQVMRPIEVESLTVNYNRGFGKPKLRAVDGLTLSVDDGECVGFIGPNGAGKSTTIKVMMGFIFPQSGRAWVSGHPAGSVAAKRTIGYLPEVAQYYPFMTATEVLFLYGSAQKLPRAELRARVPALLAQVGLKGREKELLRKFSKGMMQRVGIAQALMGDPKLLILDEVTSGLDPVGRRDIRGLLLERKQSGATIFFSSHELTEVAQLCDRIILIDNGRKLEEHRVKDLLDRLRTYQIVFKADDFPADLPDTAARDRVEEGVWRIQLKDHEDFLRSLEFLRVRGMEIIESSTVESSLEEYFVKAIGGKVT